MDLKIDYTCPRWGRTMKIKLNEMHPGNTKRCICGTEIRFDGDDMRKAQRAWDDLERTIKRLGKS
jgi:hypothetical protein